MYPRHFRLPPYLPQGPADGLRRTIWALSAPHTDCDCPLSRMADLGILVAILAPDCLSHGSADLACHAALSSPFSLSAQLTRHNASGREHAREEQCQHDRSTNEQNSVPIHRKLSLVPIGCGHDSALGRSRDRHISGNSAVVSEAGRLC
jgi:hypothetical protein